MKRSVLAQVSGDTQRVCILTTHPTIYVTPGTPTPQATLLTNPSTSITWKDYQYKTLHPEGEVLFLKILTKM